MSLYDVKKIQIMSVLKIFPIVFGILGIVIGIFTFFLAPNDAINALSFGQKFAAYFIFIILYTLIMAIGALVVTFLYNVVVAKILGSGVVISLEPKE